MVEPLRRESKESLVEYASRLSTVHLSGNGHEERGRIGQFFTAKSVARFMAGMFDLGSEEIRFLEPGAGTGILTAAFCEEVIREGGVRSVHIDAYETDGTVTPLLEKVLSECENELKKAGVLTSFSIIPEDFILKNSGYMRKGSLFEDEDPPLYDLAISNPPYYKLGKDSQQAKALPDVVSGQPNMYPLFMALTSSMLKPRGQMVFITPRSFCSGLYYKKFREWFLSRNRLLWVHNFESRKQVFDGDEILQENVITKVGKGIEGAFEIKVTISEDRDLDDLREIQVAPQDVVFRQNGDIFIRIPASMEDLETIHTIDSWGHTLHGLGLEISTGPVVDFRTDFLLKDVKDAENAVPLLWMHNLKEMRVKWPNGVKDKPLAIEDREETRNILLPMKNYVVIKRFTSKEQKRRLYAAVLLKDDLPYEKIGIENHLNYIYRPGGELTEEEAFGIAALLDTKMVDDFFRALNGHTQVNATEIRCLPLPDMESIRSIGRTVLSREEQSTISPEAIVQQVLSID